MAERAQIDFTIDGAPAAQTLGELEMKAEQLTEALKGAKIGSEEYGKLNQKLVETNRQVKNLELGFEALDKEQVASELGSVAGAVGDVTSALILLGGEDETIQQMAANIQMAIGVSMAFKGAIEGASSAMKLFNNVLKVNPIFLIITAVIAVGAGIAAMIVYWDKFVGALVAARDAIFGVFNMIIEFFFGVSDAIETASMAEQKAFEKRKKQQEEIAKAHKERLKQIRDERDAILSAADETINALELEKDTLEAQGKSSDAVTIKILEAEKAKTEAVLNATKQQLEAWINYYTLQAQLAGQTEEEFKKSMAARGVPLDEFHKKATDLIKEQEGLVKRSENDITEFKRKQSEKRLADAKTKQAELDALAKKAYDEELKRLHDLQAERNSVLDEVIKIENAYTDSQLTAQERETNAVRDKYFNLIEQAEQFGIDSALLKEAQESELLAIEQKYLDLDIQEKERKQKEFDDFKASLQQKEEDRIQRNKDAALELFNAADGLQQMLHDKELKRLQEKAARGEQLTQKEIKRLQRQDKIDKAFALAKIAKDTAQGVMSAVAAGAGTPFPGNLFAIASGIAAVIAGATQAAQILGESVDIPTTAGAAGGGGADGIDTNTTPTIDPRQFGSTYLNNESQMVYVLEQDISKSQKKVKAIESNATFG